MTVVMVVIIGGAERVSRCSCNHQPAKVVVRVAEKVSGCGCNNPPTMVVMAVVVGGAKRSAATAVTITPQWLSWGLL
jgi:hypothetical protein